MPKVTFNDSEALVFELIPRGDYVAEVVKVESGLSQKPKTKGCEEFNIQLKVDNTNCKIWDDLTFGYEKLQWKLDVFLKSFNFLVGGKPLAKGQAFDIAPEDLVGLRGHVSVGIRDYEDRDKNKKQINEIKVYLTDKPKLARNAPVAAVAAATEEPDWN